MDGPERWSDRDAGRGALVVSRLATIVMPLFVPANRPERFAKAAASGADAVILDLEDAVPADAKDAARAALTADFTDLPVLVRVNAPGTSWHERDLEAVAQLPLIGIIVPKAERDADMARVAAIHPVLALVETVKGLASTRTLAGSGHVTRIAFGSVDYAADLGCAHVRSALAAARAELVFASRLAGLPAPLDGVSTDVSNDAAAADDARHARDLGFTGKLLIHPRQVQAIRTALQPDAAEIAWAKRVLASGDGAVLVDGTMIDEPVRIHARAILARASAF